MHVHIEGMGVLGSLIAHQLLKEFPRTEITWHDTNEKYVAWKACTGAIYPSGDKADEWARKWWLDFSKQRDDCMERADYWFSQKRPPHGGKYAIVRTCRGLKLANATSVHFNAQIFVPWMRKRLGKQIKPPQVTDVGAYIVAHGYSIRLDRYYWGWTRLVRLRYDDALGAHARPCFYLRKGRLFFYAYPVPGEEWWYAGSSLIQQQVGSEKSLDIASKYETWKRNFLELGNGVIRIVQEGESYEGWRPAGHPKDTSMVARCSDGSLLVPSLWHSGVRQFPLVWYSLKKRLERRL